MPNRIRILIILHLLLAVVPLAEAFLPADMAYLPLLWASVRNSYRTADVARAVGRSGQHSIPLPRPGCDNRLRGLARCRWIPTDESVDAVVAAYVVIVLAVGCASLPMRRIFELRRDPDDSQSGAPQRSWQFSILGLLIVTAIVALVLELIRRAQPMAGNPGHSEFANQALGLISLALDAFVAAWASLSVGKVRRTLARHFWWP